MRARILFVEIAAGDIESEKLSACQRDAVCGLYAQAAARYIQWLAPKLDEVRAEMSAGRTRYREQATHDGLHRRTPSVVADLLIGWERFLSFAHETEALTRGEAEGYRARVSSALIEVASRQSEHQREANGRSLPRIAALRHLGWPRTSRNARAHRARQSRSLGLVRKRARAQPSADGVAPPRRASLDADRDAVAIVCRLCGAVGGVDVQEKVAPP